uniref:Protein TIFY n=1 Tax=Aquilaria sinensis TaxID=210372 RepID=A0A1U8XVD2_9ROSI|nr:jasmonate ZIM-domain protein [Aquilaria sinensis]
MERDFLGLSAKEPLPLVKEEVCNDGFKETGFSKGSGVQWPCVHKVSAALQMMSFNVAQGDKINGIGSETPSSSGFRPFSSMVAYDPALQLSRTEIQMFPVLEQPISVPVSKPIFKNHFAPYNQNQVANPTKPQLFGGMPVASPHLIPPTVGSVGGSTESPKGVKVSGSPAQLTIFYAGAVCVFEEISPEKAQAIMYLAGNGASVATAIAQPKPQVKPPSPKPVVSDIGPTDLSINTPPNSGLGSPLSVSSPTGGQSGSGSTSTDEVVAKTMGFASNSISKVEPQKNGAGYGVCFSNKHDSFCSTSSQSFLGQVSGEAQGKGYKCSTIQAE